MAGVCQDRKMFLGESQQSLDLKDKSISSCHNSYEVCVSSCGF